MYDRGTKETRLIVVGQQRTRDILLPIIDQYVDSFVEEGVDYEDFRALDMRTRIYSDGWAAYGTREIEKMGFKHQRVIHQNRGGIFHTNSIESYWSRLKSVSNYFTGLSTTDVLYIQSWVSYAHFLEQVASKSNKERQEKLLYYLRGI